jgi:hypothetical protein
MRWQIFLFIYVIAGLFGVLCGMAGISLWYEPTLSGWIVTVVGSASTGCLAGALASVIWKNQ